MSDMMSQEDIEAMLRGMQSDSEPVMLTGDEEDALGEIGNICMGTSATTMYTLLNHRVTITTPRVTAFASQATMLSEYDDRPLITVEVMYTEGLEGKNLLVLKEEDAMIITDLLMGGDGVVAPGAELSELHLSAISEVMNQMVGSSATALANMLQKSVNISPPNVAITHFNEEPPPAFFDEGEPVVRISFKMEIEGVLDSQIMQIMPLDFSKKMVQQLLGQEEIATQEAEAARNKAAHTAAVPAAPVAPSPVAPSPVAPPAPAYASAPPVQVPAPAPQQQYQQAPAHAAPAPVVQQVRYETFDEAPQHSGPVGDLGLIIDVPVQVTVELGRTKKSVKDVLGLGVGSLIVLDKLAGEPVEVLVNGRLIARGEVVVIDDNYGIRITEVFSASKVME